MNLRVLARVVLAPAAVAALVPMSAAAMTFHSHAPAVTPKGVRTLADVIPDTTGLTTTIVDDVAGGPVEGAIPAGDTVHDTGMVWSLGSNGTPVGTVYFTFFTNDSCSAPGVPAGSATPDGSGFADGSALQGPLAPGGYSFDAHFVSADPSLWTDAFSDCEPLYVLGSGAGAADLTVSKTAVTSFTRTYDWTIAKAVDKTLVEQSGGTGTFNYTVNAAETGFTDSGWTVGGTITVSNPNDSEDVTVSLSDSLPGCTLDATSVTVPAATPDGPGTTDVGYSCPLPSGTDGTNTVTATWDQSAASTPDDSASGSAAYVFGSPTTTVDSTVTVTDSYAGTLGTLTASDTQPFASATYTYPRAVNVLGGQCVTYPNTAAITGTGQSAGQSVEVCGTNTGALTIGYWQNKNGQAIVTRADQTALLTYLTGFNPFKDATAPLSAYVTTVIKSASAGGSTMNAMLKAQMLATALDAYFSDPSLGGNRIGASVPIGGVSIDLTNVPPIGNVSSAFGGASHLTVAQILSYAASRSNNGGSVWYGNVKSAQEPAKDTFDAINNAVALLY